MLLLTTPWLISGPKKGQVCKWKLRMPANASMTTAEMNGSLTITKCASNGARSKAARLGLQTVTALLSPLWETGRQKVVAIHVTPIDNKTLFPLNSVSATIEGVKTHPSVSKIGSSFGP